MPIHAPTHIHLKEGRFRLHARLRFSKDFDELLDGLSLKEHVLQELALQFSHQNPRLTNMVGNDYDFPQYKDKRIKIASKFQVVQKPPYVSFHYLDALGVCAVPMFVLWRWKQNKHIFMFRGDIRTKRIFTPLIFRKIAAHEFGHALGINDLYGGWAPYALAYRREAAVTAEMPLHDIMRTHFIEQDFFTPNDLEMAWMAQTQNAPQSHVRLGWYRGFRRISQAIRLENVSPNSTKRT